MTLRREDFEKAYAEAHSMTADDFTQYRMGDSYRLPMIAKCWRFWQMARVLDMNLQPDVLVAYADGCMVCGQWGGHFGLPCPKTRATAEAGTCQGDRP
ncbi:hypothetical protein ACI77I_11635 [Pseudomonas sp. D47]|uniref:hypothetical protein n=1 Tax=Pseudomonas sp. D47 TaxID=3159447 RepID=UPI00387AFAF6